MKSISRNNFETVGCPGIQSKFKSTASLEDCPSRIRHPKAEALSFYKTTKSRIEPLKLFYSSLQTKPITRIKAWSFSVIHLHGNESRRYDILLFQHNPYNNNQSSTRYSVGTMLSAPSAWSSTAKRSLPPNTIHTRHEMTVNQTMQTSPGALVF